MTSGGLVRGFTDNVVEKMVFIMYSLARQCQGSCFSPWSWWGNAREDWEGVAHRVPETVRMALLSTVSSLWVWTLRHQAGAQYSAAEKTSTWDEMRSVLVAAPHVVPARHRINATREVTLALSLSRCWRYVRERSSLTPRYVGVA